MKIKLLDERCKPEQHGDWCDLKMCEVVDWATDSFIEPKWNEFLRCWSYTPGAIFKISLGVAIEIPKGYHAQVVARSSTRRNYGVLLTNAIGIIDEAYCGDNDIWMAEFIAVSPGTMKIGDRVLQFRLVKNGDPIEFEYVEHLGNADRGGFGSTGR